MKKRVNKFTKILLLMSMIISDLMTPIKVFADEMTEVTPNKGDIGINNAVSTDDSVTVSIGSLANEGDVQVTKTVSKTETEGRYKIEFNIKGKEVVNSSQITKPVYVVVVFDRSGSMQNYCIDNVLGISQKDMGTEENCGFFGDYYTLYPKWKNSVDGAKSFATTLLTKIPDAQIALVTFASTTNSTPARGFSNSNLDNADFGEPYGATNLHSGLIKANELLSSESIPANANKYIVVISDGEPTYYLTNSNNMESYAGPGNTTSQAVLNATYGTATTIKNNGTEIFAVGYDLDEDSFNVTGYGNLTAETILRNVASTDTAEDISKGINHYLDADPAAIATAFTNIATSISRVPAGTNATLTDNIGSKFKIVGGEGNAYTSSVISEITESGTTISFDVEIDESKVTDDGWYNTNDGFSLTYTDSNGNTQTLSTSENPQVYWTPNIYEYTVNYYKDSIGGDPIASDVIKVTNGTVVSSIEQNKYLNNNSLGTVGYEVNSVSTLPVTIIDNSTVINVLYTIKKFNYVVELYYDGILENTIIEQNINYGTVVDSTTYHDDGNREGYSLDLSNSTSGNITVDNNNVVIKVYYKKNTYGYTVNYHFNNTIDNSFTKPGTALFGTTIKAEDNYLDDSKLNDKNTGDNTEYFINPSYPSNPNEIVIGIDSSENVINIYYVSTVVSNEDISKNSSTDKITSGDTEITYTVDYTSVVNNIKKGDTVKVVITDTLPLEIDEGKSILNGGVYNASNKTITWTFETTMAEFTERYDASRTITYTVVYKNVGNSDGSALTNCVIGQTSAGGKTTTGKGASVDVKVEIPAEVIVHHYVKGTTNSVASDEKLNGQVGKRYTTNYMTDILGYTIDMGSIPVNANGVYTEDIIEVTYYYVKNDGTIDNTNVVKTSTDSDKVIDSVNSVFGYTIDAHTEVKDYVGKATLKVEDILPYEIDTEKSNIGNCKYDDTSKTILCTKEYSITEEDYTINNAGEKVFVIDETFTLELVFIGLYDENVTNNAKVEVILDDSKITDEDKDYEDVTVEKGKVTSTYKDTEGNTLYNDVTIEGLVGNNYTTEEKIFFGYTLTSIPENKDGIYTKEDITVEYIYTKNDGSIDNVDVLKTSIDSDKVIDSVGGIFGYIIDAYAEVKDYVGKATLKVEDILPYEIDEEKSDIGICDYDRESKIITCTKDYTITEEDYTTNNAGEKVFAINETFTLDLTFIGIDSEIVTNNAKVEVILDDGKITEEDNDLEDVMVSKGTVLVTYKDTDGNILHTDVTTTALAGTSYTTEIKEFYGYNLVKVPANKEGTYLANQTITVNYIYSKNDGKIENPKVEKIGPDSVNGIDKEFNYTFKYSATINEYTGKVTLELVDKLPFDAVILSMDNACVYNRDNLTITCEKEYDITETTTIDEEFNVTLKYIGIEFDDINENTTLTNSLTAELTYGDNKITNSDEKDTIIKTGTVVATYKDTEGNTLHADVTTSDLAGTTYVTDKIDFFGYTLIEEPSNKEGTYLANQTVTVNYIYTKNKGNIDDTDVVKTSTDTDKLVESVSSVFGYIIDAYAEVKDYVGKVTLKVEDILPYEIDTGKSNIGNCTYNGDSKTIICTKEYTITEEDYTINNSGEKVFVIDETFTLQLAFIAIDSETVTNNAKLKVILDDSNITEEDSGSEDVTVEKGKITVTYKDIDGNSLHADIITEGLVGNNYITDEKVFYGYSLTEIPENKNGVYKKENITVNYVYSKNVGTSVEELVKSGKAEIEKIDSEFEYTITYNTTITDYVGEATLTIIDELPHEIDDEKSIYNRESCEYIDGKLVCTYKKNINEEDNVFEMEEKFVLYYINITDSKVTNKVTSKLIYGTTTKENDSEYTSEVKEGTVIVNYVNKNGDKLTDTITLTGMVGDSYVTNKKIFDKYNFIEVDGEVEGKYIDGVIEVTYVYDLTPLPPQTGVEFNPFMFIKYLLFAAIIIVSGKTYKLIKNN